MDYVAIVILVLAGVFVLSGVYKGFTWSIAALGAMVLSCILGFAFRGLIANAFIKNDVFYEAMLSYTEGSEYVYDVELVKKNIIEISNDQLDEIMEKSKLPFPMKDRVYNNIMREAFKSEGVETLGDYFNESIVRVTINIISFLIAYLFFRILLTFSLCWVDYSIVLPKLRKADALLGALVGVLRGVISALVLCTVIPAVLTVLPFDSIKNMLDSSKLAKIFYTSNLILKLMPGR